MLYFATSRPCEEGELFTEYLEWMNNHTSEIQGKVGFVLFLIFFTNFQLLLFRFEIQLYCTRCLAKLGSYNWCGKFSNHLVAVKCRCQGLLLTFAFCSSKLELLLALHILGMGSL